MKKFDKTYSELSKKKANATYFDHSEALSSKKIESNNSLSRDSKWKSHCSSKVSLAENNSMTPVKQITISQTIDSEPK